MNKYLLAALAVIFFTLLTLPAFADDVATTATVINFSSILTTLIQAGGAGVLALGGVLIRTVTSKFKVDGLNASLNNALAHACSSAEASLISKVGSTDFAQFDTHSTAVASATQFLQGAIPDVLKQLNLSEETIASMVSGFFAKTNPSIVQPGVQSIYVPQSNTGTTTVDATAATAPAQDPADIHSGPVVFPNSVLAPTAAVNPVIAVVTPPLTATSQIAPAPGTA